MLISDRRIYDIAFPVKLCYVGHTGMHTGTYTLLPRNKGSHSSQDYLSSCISAIEALVIQHIDKSKSCFWFLVESPL